MSFKEVAGWAENHPWETGGIVFVGGLILLWLLGYFNKSPAQQGNNGTLAAAYYQAELAQTVAGTQLQIAQANTKAQTAQAQIMADAATKINAQNTAASVAITQTNATAATDINASQTNASVAMNKLNTYAGLIQTIVPQEMAMNGGSANVTLPGFGTIDTYSGVTPSPNMLSGWGYNPAQIAQFEAAHGFGS